MKSIKMLLFSTFFAFGTPAPTQYMYGQKSQVLSSKQANITSNRTKSPVNIIAGASFLLASAYACKQSLKPLLEYGIVKITYGTTSVSLSEAFIFKKTAQQKFSAQEAQMVGLFWLGTGILAGCIGIKLLTAKEKKDNDRL